METILPFVTENARTETGRPSVRHADDSRRAFDERGPCPVPLDPSTSVRSRTVMTDGSGPV